MKYIKYIAVACMLAIAAYAATDLNVSLVNDPRPQHFVNGFYVGKVATVGGKITATLGNSATIDFAATSVGEVLSSAITVTGAKAGDTCTVGVPTAAGALAAEFTCFVSATDAVKVKFAPHSKSAGTTAALNGASPSVITATVLASSVCTCAPNGATATIAAGGCAVGVSGTTATFTSANGLTNTLNYDCSAPVDPASGTYYVRVTSSQAQ